MTSHSVNPCNLTKTFWAPKGKPEVIMTASPGVTELLLCCSPLRPFALFPWRGVPWRGRRACKQIRVDGNWRHGSARQRPTRISAGNTRSPYEPPSFCLIGHSDCSSCFLFLSSLHFSSLYLLPSSVNIIWMIRYDTVTGLFYLYERGKCSLCWSHVMLLANVSDSNT